MKSISRKKDFIGTEIDADWAGCVRTRRSTFFQRRGLVCWLLDLPRGAEFSEPLLAALLKVSTTVLCSGAAEVAVTVFTVISVSKDNVADVTPSFSVSPPHTAATERLGRSAASLCTTTGPLVRANDMACLFQVSRTCLASAFWHCVMSAAAPLVLSRPSARWFSHLFWLLSRFSHPRSLPPLSQDSSP